MTAHRKHTTGPVRQRTAAEWMHSEWCLVDDDLRDLYVGGRPYPTWWEAHRASLLVLVVLACLLVMWLVWGGRW